MRRVEEPGRGSRAFRATVLSRTVGRLTFSRSPPARVFQLLQGLLAAPRVVFFGFQPFAGDCRPRPFLLEPTAQPSRQKGDAPATGARTIPRLLEHDHGDQNGTAKKDNAQHEADDEALRVHVPRSARADASEAGKRERRHHPFVGDYEQSCVPHCRSSVPPQRNLDLRRGGLPRVPCCARRMATPLAGNCSRIPSWPRRGARRGRLGSCLCTVTAPPKSFRDAVLGCRCGMRKCKCE
jgi:hypothetical protein